MAEEQNSAIQREVPEKDGEEFAKQYGFIFYELSTKKMSVKKFEIIFANIIEQIIPIMQLNSSNLSRARFLDSTGLCKICVPNGGCTICTIF